MESGYTSDQDTLTPHWAGRHRRKFRQPSLDQRIKEETGPVRVHKLTPAEIAERYPEPPAQRSEPKE